MAVSVVLITHKNIGTALVEAATATLGELPLPTTVVTILEQTDPEDLVPKLKKICPAMECGEGMLILTDLYGSTPSNIAKKLKANERIHIVSGLNLPMLLRIMNYPDLDVKALAEKAKSGGKNGIIENEC